MTEPVTLGDLICAERKQGEGGHGPGYFDRRPATVADLKSACRALDWLVIEKVDGRLPSWLEQAAITEGIDLYLAEVQP